MSRRSRAVLAVVVATAFLTMLDNTVVTVAAPSIARDLGVGLAALEWVATGYMLPYAGLLLAGGRLTDRYGTRRMLLAGLGVFTAASLAAGLTGQLIGLLVARAVQGAGAALLVPATLAAVAAAGDRERLRGAAAWTVSGAVALAAGPVVGGLLSEHLHWSWIFLLNVPAGLAALVTVWCAVPAGIRRHGVTLGLPGVCTATFALTAVTFALTSGAGYAVAAAVAGAAVFVLVERRSRDPLLGAGLFAARAYRGGVAVQVLWGLGVNGVFFYTAMYLQDVRGFRPAAAGLAFLPVAAAVALGAPLAPALVRRLGVRRTVTAGLLVVGAGIGVVAVGSADTPVLLAALAAVGFGSALTVPLAAVVLAAAPPDRAGMAGGVFAVARELSGVLGIAGVGVVVITRGDLAGGYRLGLIAAAVLVCVGALIGARTQPGPGADVASAERGDQSGPGGVQLPLPVRPGMGAVAVDVDGGRDTGE
ncbi:MFS transporter [Actinoplanes sp. NEAU-A12]|uniref:MFS transporter n=1 Tax=Actinoplanes sandaracinus TaxID=3045177 RepID=A0ABT6WY82_9ACTN|nr:MFS transporter [Actinoplanes sandaracinus]MDI6104571.1 MFS transporter [Actinoplanes sandaracinus]